MKKFLCMLLTTALVSSATAYAAPETVLETETADETAISVAAAFAAEETIDYNAPLYGVKIGYTDFSDTSVGDTTSKNTVGMSGVWTNKTTGEIKADDDGKKYLHYASPENWTTVGFQFDETITADDSRFNDTFTLMTQLRFPSGSKTVFRYRLTNMGGAVNEFITTKTTHDGGWHEYVVSKTPEEAGSAGVTNKNITYLGAAVVTDNAGYRPDFDIGYVGVYRMPAAGTGAYSNIKINGKVYTSGMLVTTSDKYTVSFELPDGLLEAAKTAILDAPAKYYPGAETAVYTDNTLTLTFGSDIESVKLISLANANGDASYPAVTVDVAVGEIDYNAPLYGLKIGYTDFSNFTKTTSVSTSADIQPGSGLALGTIWNTTGSATDYSASASVVVENGEKYLHVVGPKNGFSLGYFIDYDAETGKAAAHDETDKSLYTAITTARSNKTTSAFAYRMKNRADYLEVSDAWNDYAVSHTINDEELSNPEDKYRQFNMVGYAFLDTGVTTIDPERYLDFKAIGVYKMPEDAEEYTYNVEKNDDGTYTVIARLANGLEKNAAYAINANPTEYFGDNVTAKYDISSGTLTLVTDADANSVTLIRLANANGTASYKSVTVAMPKAPEIKDEIDYSSLLKGIRFHAIASADSRKSANVAEYGWIVTREKIVKEKYNNDETKFNFADMDSAHYVTGIAFKRADGTDKVYILDLDTLNAEFTGIVKGIDETKYGDDVIIAKPYLKFADGTYVYGSARKATINTAKNGEFSK